MMGTYISNISKLIEADFGTSGLTNVWWKITYAYPAHLFAIYIGSL